MKNYDGKRFGRLVVLSAYSAGKDQFAEVQCDCGVRKTVRVANLNKGNTSSCGCIRKEMNECPPIKHGYASKAMAGEKVPRLYATWVNMRQRCTNKNTDSYPYYGGRGISVCKEWNDFSVFLDFAMANGYTDDMQIDRIDSDGNYCPENCRFVTFRENMNNKRSNRLLTHNGRTLTLAQIARERGIHRNVIDQRLRSGWTVERAIETPVQTKRKQSRTAEPAGAVACG